MSRTTIRIERRNCRRLGVIYLAFIKTDTAYHPFEWHLRKEELIGVANTRREIDSVGEIYLLKETISQDDLRKE